MKNNGRIIIVLMVLTIVFTIMGATLAYFNWSSTNEQKTNVTFTVASGFSCSADGGGSITSNDKQLAPAHCDNTTYAIKRTITVHPTITQANTNIYLDLWLTVKSIGSGLSNSQNFKYALTTSSSNCTTDVVTQGNFWLAEANTKRYLLQDKMYTSTTTETYYLWIWLDYVESDPATQNQSFNIELGGDCTDSKPIYTTNIYDEADQANTVVWVGQPISNNIAKFYDPNGGTQAMNALRVATGNATDYPFFLKHKIDNETLWCAANNESSLCVYSTQAECTANITSNFGSGYTCQQSTYTDGISRSYVGFVVTPTMVANNPGMTAGTYYLKGGTNGNSYNYNKSVLLSAFGSSYCANNSSNYYCTATGLTARAYSTDYVYAHITGMNCVIREIGVSFCTTNT